MLLRQISRDQGSWDLDYATIGPDSPTLWVEARDELGNEYTVASAWHNRDEGLEVGTYTFAPGLAEGVKSLQVRLSREESTSTGEPEREKLTPRLVATHWADEREVNSRVGINEVR